jgi:hypothetical protein
MTPEEGARLTAACGLLGTHEAEKRLLHGEIDDVSLYHPGTADTYKVVFADGAAAAFKSLEGSERNAAQYGHTGISVLLNDVAAWLVARGLGFEDLVKGVVLRPVALERVGIGTLQAWHEGEPSGSGWEACAQVRRAALFDALIGQQDRNGTNFNYDPDADELGLFDNSYSFAQPGDQTSASAIVASACEDAASLEGDLLDALDRFARSPERTMAEEVIDPARWARVLERHSKMLETGELLEPFDF